MKTVSIDEMGNAIAKEFEEYVELTTDEVKKICKEVADDCKEKIQESAPVDTGRYKKSWNITETDSKKNGIQWLVKDGKVIYVGTWDDLSLWNSDLNNPITNYVLR